MRLDWSGSVPLSGGAPIAGDAPINGDGGGEVSAVTGSCDVLSADKTVKDLMERRYILYMLCVITQLWDCTWTLPYLCQFAGSLE